MKTPPISAQEDGSPIKANSLQRCYVACRSVAAILYTTATAMLLATFGKCSREFTNRHLRRWAKKTLSFANVQYTVNNPHNLTYQDDHCYMIMSNHSSLYDIPLILDAIPGNIRMLSKKDLFKLPFVGKGMRAMEFIAIDRKNRPQALIDLEVAKEKMRSGIRLWTAPEGARSLDGQLQPFKKGVFITAIQTGATIIPIAITGAHAILPAKTTDLTLNGQVQIIPGTPIDASHYTLENKEDLMQAVEEEIRSLSRQHPLID